MRIQQIHGTSMYSLQSILYYSISFPQNISILVVLLYAWRISVNMKKSSDLEDVYYGEYETLKLFFVVYNISVVGYCRRVALSIELSLIHLCFSTFSRSKIKMKLPSPDEKYTVLIHKRRAAKMKHH